MAPQILVNTGWGNGMQFDCTRPLPQPMLTNQLDPPNIFLLHIDQISDIPLDEDGKCECIKMLSKSWQHFAEAMKVWKVALYWNNVAQWA